MSEELSGARVITRFEFSTTDTVIDGKGGKQKGYNLVQALPVEYVAKCKFIGWRVVANWKTDAEQQAAMSASLSSNEDPIVHEFLFAKYRNAEQAAYRCFLALCKGFSTVSCLMVSRSRIEDEKRSVEINRELAEMYKENA